MRRLSRRGPPHAAPAEIFLYRRIISYLFLISQHNSIFNLEKYAAAKPPGAASSGPTQNIFISFAAKPHPIINIQISYEIFYTSINTELFSHYFKIIYPNELKVVCHITFWL
jgi:hypothetical protein